MKLLKELSQRVRLFPRLRARLQGQVELPPGVTPEEAVEVIARTPWARGWAEGIAKLAGYKPGTPEYEETVDRLSHFVAKRLLGLA